jgi:hypothetical protein
VAASIVAGVGIAVLFSFTVLFVARSAESRHAERPLESMAWGALAGLGVIAVGAAIALGLVVMAQGS